VIKLDFTQISVVVTCSLCPWWRGFGFDRADGWATGARHEANVHPECQQARDAARKS
jgi:hypothetical protein